MLFSFRKTLQDATGRKALEFVGALTGGPEALEVLEFHSALLLSQLSAVAELDWYHVSFPWRVVAMFDPSSRESTLQSMKEQWDFCVNFVDKLGASDKLHWWFVFSRFQPFREVMVKAEYLVSMKLFIGHIIVIRKMFFLKTTKHSGYLGSAVAIEVLTCHLLDTLFILIHFGYANSYCLYSFFLLA